MKYDFPFDLVAVSPLSHILMNMCTKDEIINLHNDYLVKYRSAMKKSELAFNFEKALMFTPWIMAEHLPLVELRELQKIVHSGGLLKSKVPLDTFFLESQKIVLLYQSKHTSSSKQVDNSFNYVIAGNLQKVLKPLVDGWVSDPKVIERDKKECMFLGMLRLYGVLPENKIVDIWDATYKSKIDFIELLRLYKQSISLRREFFPSFIDKKLMFVSDSLVDPESFYNKINERKDLDYAIYNGAFVLQYADTPFNTSNKKNVESLVEALMIGTGGDGVLTQFMLGLIWDSVQTDEDFSSLISNLTEFIRFESIDKLNDLIMHVSNFANNTPHWVLKGHYPDELYSKNPIDFADPSFRKDIDNQISGRFPDYKPHELWNKIDNKVGRNDLCPCGSGLKYKKCCGAN